MFLVKEGWLAGSLMLKERPESRRDLAWLDGVGHFAKDLAWTVKQLRGEGRVL